ncbi:O-methylsterigmatocystin oxidoreductase [Coprinopsis sp. MPI-PUGE-AT-0042]|nr:O-methylsterigmatocystin oxidoreductase [Coprinopsis sp. MPI-PUGE-AT-0042]
MQLRLEMCCAVVLCLGAAIWVLRAFHYSKRNPRRLPLPPGPRGIPFLGNVVEFSTGKLWETFQKWSHRYGEPQAIDSNGTRDLSANSMQSISDLFEKRGQNFSDRPQSPSLDMLGIGWNWGLVDSNSFWKANRRVFHRSFAQGEVLGYLPLVEQHVSLYLQRLAGDPASFAKFTKELFGATLIHISYGDGDDTYTSRIFERVEGVGRAFADMLVPGRFLVDTFPFLRHVPAWIPGAGWKRQLADLAALARRVYDSTFEEAVVHLRNAPPSAHPSVLKTLFAELPSENTEDHSAQEELIKSSTFVAYLAIALILALAMHPEVQTSCQQELDAVVGLYHLPKPSDLANLPYIRAVVEEVLRWHLVVPLGLPHVVRQDDEYNGYFIPKGTVVFANNWAVAHDANVFDNPMEFRPERYLKDGRLEYSFLSSNSAAFGFGRRICPGRHLALATLTTLTAGLMSSFNVMPAKGDDGTDMPLEYDPEPALISNVLPFDCHIVPRSERHEALLTGLEHT